MLSTKESMFHLLPQSPEVEFTVAKSWGSRSWIFLSFKSPVSRPWISSAIFHTIHKHQAKTGDFSFGAFACDFCLVSIIHLGLDFCLDYWFIFNWPWLLIFRKCHNNNNILYGFQSVNRITNYLYSSNSNESYFMLPCVVLYWGRGGGWDPKSIELKVSASVEWRRDGASYYLVW
jgi:hypothetical protein